jgi:WD40-like Beta Propeller Repeat
MRSSISDISEVQPKDELRPAPDDGRRAARFLAATMALVLAAAGTVVAVRAFEGSPPRRPMTPRLVSWARNGDIAFVRSEEPGAAGVEPKLFAVSTNGAEVRHLATGVEHPSWSPDGTKLAVDSTDSGRTEILILDAHGKLMNQVTESPSDGATITNSRPAWSPDGTRIAHVHAEGGPLGDIFVTGADGSDPVRITGAEGDDSDPAWSPGATRIAFRSYREGGAGIFVVDTDTGEEVALATGWADVADPSWSPDGERVVFAGFRGGNFDLYSVSLDGTGLTGLTRGPANEMEPTWSPDGTGIAFAGDGDGDSEIYVMAADGSNVTKVTDNETEDFQPSWQPLPIPGPEETPAPAAEAQIEAIVDLGGAQDATPGAVAVGEGAVWAATWWSRRDDRNVVSRIDLETNEITARIPIDGQAWGMAAGEGGVWAAIPLYEEPRTAASGGVVQRIDPTTNRVVATTPVGPYPEPIAVGGGSVWVVADDASEDSQQLFRIDPASNRVTSRTPVPRLSDGYIDEMAVVMGDVWLLQHEVRPGSDVEHNGYVVRVDGRTGQVVATIAAEGINMATGDGGIVTSGRIEERGGWPHSFVARILDPRRGEFVGPPVLLENGVHPTCTTSEGVWATSTVGRFGWLQISRLDSGTLEVSDRFATLKTSIATDYVCDSASRSIWIATGLDGSGEIVRIELIERA